MSHLYTETEAQASVFICLYYYIKQAYPPPYHIRILEDDLVMPTISRGYI